MNNHLSSPSRLFFNPLAISVADDHGNVSVTFILVSILPFFLVILMTIHMIFSKSNTTGVTNRAGTPHPLKAEAPDFTIWF
jgi:hypothetical protein